MDEVERKGASDISKENWVNASSNSSEDKFSHAKSLKSAGKIRYAEI